MSTIKTNNTSSSEHVDNKSTDKGAEVAPYMITKKAGEQETPSKTGVIIPMVLSLILAVIIITSFFEDEYKALITNLSALTEDTSENSNSTNASNTPIETKVVNTTVATDNDPSEIATSSSSMTENSMTTSTQSAIQPGIITVYNPYLRPYPQVYAPIYQQTPSYNAPAPYRMAPQQRMSYNEMMQRRQQKINERNMAHNAFIQRMEKDRRELQMKIEQRRAEYQDTNVRMLKRMRGNQELNEI